MMFSTNQLKESNTYQNTPKYSFKPTKRGQAAYILDECERQGLYAKYSYGKVRIFAETKKELFLDIIMKSEEVANEHVGLIKSIQIWRTAHGVFCVGIKEVDEDIMYTTERHVAKMVINQYLGVIPYVKHTRVFGKEDEFKEAIIRKGVLV